VFSLLLGPKWLPAADIFRWLGVAGLHQLMTSTVGWLFISQGRGGDLFKMGVWVAVTTIAAFVVGLPWGPVGVAAAYAISDCVIRLPLIWMLAGRSGPVSVRDLIAIGLPHLIATVLAGLVLMGLAHVLGTLSLVHYLLLMAASYVGYVATIALFPAKRRILQANFRMIIATNFRWPILNA
jgi:PST family polysaccharide transporter